MADPARRRSHTPAMYQRRRLLVLVCALVLIAGAVFGVVKLVGRDGTQTSKPRVAANSADRQPTSTTHTRLVASQIQARLPTPISGEAVTTARGAVLAIGGLDGSNNSADSILGLDPTSASWKPAGTLDGPLHDAAAASIDGRVLLFGGGTTASTDTVREFAPGRAARQAGTLPTARSDLSAVTISHRTYVLGGYDGQTPIPDVLATTDGTRFSTVAELPVPVRYAAAVADGSRIFLFGGLTAAGSSSDAIQSVDPQRGTARIVGHLSTPLDHASAVNLRGRIYLLGGNIGGTATDRIELFDPATGAVKPAGTLPMAVADAGATVAGETGYLVGGVGATGQTLGSTIALRLKSVTVPSKTANTAAKPRPNPDSVRPFAGQLMIADRGNDRILVVNAKKHILWRYPAKGRPAPAGGFNFPDDAFFIHHGRGIITNQEENETVVELGYPSGKVLWSYGHPGQIGSTAGYLHEPDDAYLLRNGTITVADAQNCRILFIKESDHSTRQLGTTGVCAHDPPRTFGSPNGDTPLRNGDILVSEVNGSYIDEITPSGHVVWSTHLPIAYPSDPQKLGPNLYLTADYSTPGGVVEFNRAGKILWSYMPTSGDAMLDHPSLAEQLPNGLIAVNDDYRDRVVLIDPKTKQIVWQYGHTDQPGTGADQLNTPDGLDLLFPSGEAPTHPFTG